ncbi:hypothetical protein M0802_010531 [Mischocyttarus mexicanus]|nr:hypothetical protein M0802_010531 [Mischocyttarus mexicanus]
MKVEATDGSMRTKLCKRMGNEGEGERGGKEEKGTRRKRRSPCNDKNIVSREEELKEPSWTKLMDVYGLDRTVRGTVRRRPTLQEQLRAEQRASFLNLTLYHQIRKIY